MRVNRSPRRYLELGLFAASVLLFTLWPELDLWVSGRFYDAVSGGFRWSDWTPVRLTYEVFANIHFVLLPLLFAAWLYCRTKGYLRRKRLYLFLLLSLLLGPGILANIVIKDNSLGRARPVQVAEFGGNSQFSRAFEYSGQCDHNCSFVSGHAAMGFYFTVLGWIGLGWRGFWLGMAVGTLVGLGRIVQGGHFLSDVVFAFWLVYGVNQWLAARIGVPWPGLCASRSVPQPG